MYRPWHHVSARPELQVITRPSEADIGGTFHYRDYENAELVSSKQLTTFSDHRLPLSTPDHISLPQYVDYLHSYVARFRLDPHIRLRCRVNRIAPSTAQPWRHQVTYREDGNLGEERTFNCSHVAICTGLHVEPNMPSVPGIENVIGQVFHSSDYKKRSQLAGKDVLVMGCGETAMGTPKPVSLSRIVR